MPYGKLTRIKDFLPSPEECARMESFVRITITLNLKTIDFFKEQAKKHNSKYQKMIRMVLDNYVEHFS